MNKSNIFVFIAGILVGAISFVFIYNSLHTHDSASFHDLGKADSTYDLRFINAMVSHHMGAVEMAQMAVDTSKNKEVIAISKGIIDSQNVEIALMNVWKKDWYKDSKEVKLGEYSLMRNLGTYDEKFDLRYLNAMIIHHQGAIDMCTDVLTKSTKNQVLTICNNIIGSQSHEIDQMNKLREKLYSITK